MKIITFIAAVLLMASCTKDIYESRITEKEFDKQVCGQKWMYWKCRHLTEDGSLSEFERPDVYGGGDRNTVNGYHSFAEFEISEDKISYRYWDGELGERHDESCEITFKDSKVFSKDDLKPILTLLDVDGEYLYCLEEHNPNTQAGAKCISLYVHYDTYLRYMEDLSSF